VLAEHRVGEDIALVTEHDLTLKIMEVPSPTRLLPTVLR
jgi:hypothetical protein